jgi:hypothetical protein
MTDISICPVVDTAEPDDDVVDSRGRHAVQK